MSAAPVRQLETAHDPRQQYLDVLEREHATTVRVLRAYPADEPDLKPHGKCKTARELAWMFVMEQALTHKAITTGLDFNSAPARREPSLGNTAAMLEATPAPAPRAEKKPQRSTRPAPEDVIIVHVMAREQPLPGRQLLQAALDCGLRFGEIGQPGALRRRRALDQGKNHQTKQSELAHTLRLVLREHWTRTHSTVCAT